MSAIVFEGLFSAAPSVYLTGITDLDIQEQNGTTLLYVTSQVFGGVSCYEVGPGGALNLLNAASYGAASFSGAVPQLASVSMPSEDVFVAFGTAGAALPCFTLTADGRIDDVDQITGAPSLANGVSALATIDIGADTFVYAGHLQSPGITVYQPSAANQLTQVDRIGTGGQNPELVALETVSIGSKNFLLSASALTETVTSYRIGANGALVEVDSLGIQDGLGTAGITDLYPVTMAGVTYLVAPATQSHTLSLIRVHSDGTLSASDHLHDTLETRFGSAAALDVITVDGRSFVAVGGGDDGLTLFTILPTGRFLSLGQIADTQQTALQNVTSIALHADGDELVILASSETETGLTRLSVDLSNLGDTLLGTGESETPNGGNGDDLIDGGPGRDFIRGQGGDDILVDGIGTDTLTGGNGADIFVFTPDGQDDVITDFQVGVDRMDLSALGWLRSIGQIDIQSTSDGGVITVGTERVIVTTSNASPLTAASLNYDDLVDSEHGLFIAPTAPIGTRGNDTMTGANDSEEFTGLGGNDVLYGLDGADSLWGNSGDDSLYGQKGRDRLYGGSGQDLLLGGSGSDRLYGGTERDVLRGGFGNDRLFGDTGNDRLYGDSGNDQLKGGDGRDEIEGNAGNDKLDGDSGRDNLSGGRGKDTVNGGTGHDTLDGGGGRDWLSGNGGDDVLYGKRKSDIITGGNGSDLAHGGSGNDRILGGAGNDTGYGQSGGDTLKLGKGRDVGYGGSGSDVLEGQGGRDTLEGGKGKDILTGGASGDVFVFADGHGRDVIQDFNPRNAKEFIDLSAISTITSFGDLRSNHMTQRGDNVLITTSNGHTIKLIDVQMSELSGQDFIF